MSFKDRLEERVPIEHLTFSGFSHITATSCILLGFYGTNQHKNTMLCINMNWKENDTLLLKFQARVISICVSRLIGFSLQFLFMKHFETHVAFFSSASQ